MKKNAALFLLLVVFYLCNADEFKITNPEDTSIACDYLVITPDALEESAEKLVQYRDTSNSFKLTEYSVIKTPSDPKYITLSTIFSYFNPSDTVPACLAISRMLRYAYEKWEFRLNSVVLLGDDRFEDYLLPPEKNLGSRVPTFWNLKNSASGTDQKIPDSLKIFSDNFYCYAPTEQRVINEFTSYGLMYNLNPLFAIGRIPCETNSQAQVYIEKLRLFEKDRLQGTGNNTIVYLADNAYSIGGGPYDMSGFERFAEETMTGWFNYKIYSSNYYLDADQNSSNARKAYLDAMRKNPLWSIYMGHGFPGGLSSEQLLRIEDMDSIGQTVDPYIFLSLTCSNAAYQEPYENSMCKHGLFSPKGPVVYIGGKDIIFFQDMMPFAKTLFENIPPFDDSNSQGDFSFSEDFAKSIESGDGESGNSLTFLGDPLIFYRSFFDLTKRKIDVSISTILTKSNSIRFKVVTGSSINYSVRIYRSDMVKHVQNACRRILQCICIPNMTVCFLIQTVCIKIQF